MIYRFGEHACCSPSRRDPVSLRGERLHRATAPVAAARCARLPDLDDLCRVSQRAGQSVVLTGARLRGMGLPRLINELNRGYPLRCADPSQAAGYDKRSDKQIDRARVLEVRIHLPPAWSLVRTCGGDARPDCADVGAAGTAFDTSLLRVRLLRLCPPWVPPNPYCRDVL